ncbi:hypothetical protein ACW2Q0_28205 [Nocardia sp. R16R-3T]
MAQETVQVRAEQAFQDWSVGEVRTVPRDRFVENLIRDGRLTVVEGSAPSVSDESPSEYSTPGYVGTDPAAGLPIPFADTSDEHTAAILPDGTQVEGVATEAATAADQAQGTATEAVEDPTRRRRRPRNP